MGYEINKVSIAEPVTRDVGDVSLSNRTYRLDTTVTVLPNRTMEVIVPSDFDELYAYNDTRDLDRFYSEVGIDHSSDWTSYDGGGHQYPYTVGVIKKVAPLLFKKSR
jgi:hypothetical protein